MKKLLLFLLLPLAAFGQGAHFDSNAFTTATNTPVGAQAPLYSVPNAKVTVCAYPVIPVNAVCTNKVTIYSDQSLTDVMANPLIADGQGRFGFWV